MTISGIGNVSAGSIQSLLDLRTQLNTLQQQLGTGLKSDNYAGLGPDRGLTVGLRSQLASLSSYDNTIGNVGVRMSLAQTALSQIDKTASTVKSSALASTYSPDGNGQTVDQKTAQSQLDVVLGLLNSQSGGRYLFSGKAVDQPAAESSDHILNGDGAKAGLKQVISERNQADLGASGLGRVAVSAPTATSVAVTQDSATSPFGFKLNAVNSGLTGATVSGPTGTPPAISVDLGANPSNGDTLKLTFNLPDGTTADLTLTATTASPPAAGQFTIGATPAATASNLQGALTTSLGQLAGTALSAASTVAASNDFFNVDDTHPPMRVDGPPFDTATSLTSGAADTVTWYTGDGGSDPARTTSTARVDTSLTVSYGMRANEQALRSAVANIATFAAASYSATDPNASGAYTALSQRVAANLDGPPGQQKVSDIEAEIAGAQNAAADAQSRHQSTSNTLTDLLQSIQGVPQEQVAAQIITLQTSLQASLQVTSMLLQTSLVNYLPPG